MTSSPGSRQPGLGGKGQGRGALLGAGGNNEHCGHGGKLDKRERRRDREIEEVDRLLIDLYLERAEATLPEDEHSSKRREAEEKHDGRGGCQRRPYQRKNDLAEASDGRRSQHRRGFLHGRVDPAPDPADGTDDNGDVVEDMGSDQRPQPGVEDREERGSDNDRRQDEWNRHERPDQRFAGEVETGNHPGQRQRRHHGENRGERGLPQREPGCLDESRSRERVDPAFTAEGQPQDANEGIQEEVAEEENRKNEQKCRSRVWPACSHRKISDHCSSQDCRLASITAGSICTGSGGMTVCSTNSGGNAASALAGKTNHVKGIDS